MKYKIVYLTAYENSAVYLIGHDKNGKPIYRRYTTKAPTKSTAGSMAALAAALSLGNSNFNRV